MFYCSCGAEFKTIADLKEHGAANGGLLHADTGVRAPAYPRHLYPYTLKIARCRDGHVLWSRTVTLADDTGPLQAVRFPGFGGTEHAPVKVVIEFADGTTEEHAPS